MIKTFTQNELLQYVYNELNPNVCALLEATLTFDQQLAEECAELLISQEELDSLQKSPSEKSISTILSYSRNLSLQL